MVMVSRDFGAIADSAPARPEKVSDTTAAGGAAEAGAGAAGGVVSEIIGSQASVFTEPRFTVLGLSGGIRTLGFDIQEPQLRANPDASASDFGVESEDAAAYVVIVDANGIVKESREPLTRGAWNGFYPAIRDAIRHGSPLPVPPQDVIETLRVLDAAAASAVHGNRVRLQPPARHMRHTE
jgi:predicted dehydrogenase